MDNDIRIRTARPDDLNRIMDIEYLCFDRDTVEDKMVYAERISVFGDGFLVLESEDKIAGFISSELWAHSAELNEDMFLVGHSIHDRLVLLGDELYVSSLAISPEYRGRGYGEVLFNSLIERVVSAYPSVVQVILLVGCTWKSAIKIYARSGFATIAEFKDYFGGRNVGAYDAKIMYKKLVK